jgi:plasmid maintenance system antidote protein VapI
LRWLKIATLQLVSETTAGNILLRSLMQEWCLYTQDLAEIVTVQAARLNN